MDQRELSILINSFVFILLIMVVIVFIITSVFNKRKTQLLLQQQAEKQKFDLSLIESKTEIQEQIMKNIGWELHDNIGQILSVCRLQLNSLSSDTKINEESSKLIDDSSKMIGNVLSDIRQISHLLNNEYIDFIGIVKSINIELERFNRLKYINAALNVIGEEEEINKKHEIILFRMIQELLSNVIKHAKAQSLNIDVNFDKENLKIIIEDNGVGLSDESIQKRNGIGLSSLKERASLINASLLFEKGKDSKGLKTTITYPVMQNGKD